MDLASLLRFKHLVVVAYHLQANGIVERRSCRLRLFRHPTEMTKEEIEVLSTIDLDEYYVEKIVAHKEKGRNLKNWKFKLR